MSKNITITGIYIYLYAVLTVACMPTWSASLADAPEATWSDKDRLGFLLDSPWAKRERARVGGFKTDSDARLEISAYWLSPFFSRTRAEIAGRFAPTVRPLIQYDPEASADSAYFRGPLVLRGEAPTPLTHRLFVATPLLHKKIGFWPTSPELAKAAHRRLFSLPHPDADLAAILDERFDAGEYVVIELVLWPFIARHAPRPGDPDIDECLRRLMGELVWRGASLVAADKTVRYPKFAAILAHDIGDAWENTAWRMSTEQLLVVAAPAIARLYFARKAEDGASWPGAQDEEAVLVVAAPRGAAAECAAKPEDGLEFELEFAYDLAAMRRAGADGI